MTRRRPMRTGPLVFQEGLRFDVRGIINDFAPRASEQLVRATARELQRACKFYVAHRDGHITPRQFRGQIKLLTSAADKLSSRIQKLRPFTRAELDIDGDGRPFPLEPLQNNLAQLIAQLAVLNEQESMKGRDYDDTPAAILVGDLLAVFVKMTGRTKPPSLRFDGKKHSADPDDVSSTPFGRFVVAVEAAIISSIARHSGTSGVRYRIKNKRAAIRGAIARWAS